MRWASNTPSLGWRRSTFVPLVYGLVSSLLTSGCDCNPPATPVIEAGAPLRGEARVWAVDDGEQVTRDGGRSSLMDGNSVWAPQQPIALFALRQETVAFQVVVSASEQPLDKVTVAFAEARPCGAEVQAFVVHELEMKRRSAGKNPRESLGWTAAATPPSVAPLGRLPDPLIAIEAAPSWADYPLTVAAQKNRVVWFDVYVPQDAPAGACKTSINVEADGKPLAILPLELTIAAQTLPFRGVQTMLYFDHEELMGRYRDARATDRYQQLLHAHHISAVMPLRSAADVKRHQGMLDGSLFTKEHGYRGPGQGIAADVAVVGAYGSMGPPSAAAMQNVEEIVNLLRTDATPDRDIFLYAVDEQCNSPLGPNWRKALSAAGGELSKLKVGHTCSTPPQEQPVDVVMVFAPEYNTETAALATAAGKQVWIYNGVLPYTGSFLTDSWPLSLRANAWIQARYGIERWFYWESTFWNDDNRGGKGRYDPLKVAETFHNADGDHCNGDGVLAYPGTQHDAEFRSLGTLSTMPSMRLKQWRRGISDMGYLKLARALDEEAANRIVAKVVPAALQHARGMTAPPFSIKGKDYLAARRALFDIITRANRPATP